MSKGTGKKRRREKKTDYRQRLKLLKSEVPRLVVRKSLNNTIVQLVKWNEDGDKVIAQAEAQELPNLGWKGHTGNIPAAYLAGHLLGERAEEKGVKECVLDLGLQESTQGNRIYAAAKGARDANLVVPVGEEMLPPESRVRGKHIEEYASGMSSDEKKEHFSSLMERGLDPENLSDNFQGVKKKIEKEGE
ncbi:MAG: 50S ribosomal protein L18 [Candidatus Aenigmatarchaeota archaeon]